MYDGREREQKKENKDINNLNTVMSTTSVTWPSFCMILRFDFRATICFGVELLGLERADKEQAVEMDEPHICAKALWGVYLYM